MQKGQTGFAALDIFNQNGNGATGASIGGDMRRYRYMRMGPERAVLWQWLHAKNVECGVTDLTAVQCLLQVGIID